LASLHTFFAELVRKYRAAGLARRAHRVVDAQVSYRFSHGALSGLAPEQKQELRQTVHAVVRDLLAAADPVIALRHKLVDAVYSFAQAQVLVLDKDEQRQEFLETPYLSGALKPRIAELVRSIDGLKEALDAAQALDAAFSPVDLCSYHQALNLMWANSLNVVRIALGDHDPAQDWFQPFVLSQLIACEDRYRQQLKMPSLLPHEYDGIVYGGFFKHVLDGAGNPYVTWQQAVAEVNALDCRDNELRLLAEIAIRFVPEPASEAA
jgi:hypothetical protein